MAANLTFVTAEQLATMSDQGLRYELVRGELRMMSPAGGRHGRAADRIVVMDERAECDVSDVVPGWKFAVSELFR